MTVIGPHTNVEVYRLLYPERNEYHCLVCDQRWALPIAFVGFSYPPSCTSQMPQQCAESCDQCKYFKNVGLSHGMCRRYAPSIVASDTQFPFVHQKDWCGEFTKRINNDH